MALNDLLTVETMIEFLAERARRELATALIVEETRLREMAR